MARSQSVQMGVSETAGTPEGALPGIPEATPTGVEAPPSICLCGTGVIGRGDVMCALVRVDRCCSSITREK